VALDTDIDLAKKIVESTKDMVGIYKVGPVLWMRWGHEALSFFAAQKVRVFLDFKFHDIPNTVCEAIRSLIAMDKSGVIWGMTVHTSGGYSMLKSAVETARELGSVKIFGVTVLTSLREKDLYRVGINRSVEAQVKKLAALALDTHCDGVVASAHELAVIRKACGRELLCVVPGIRAQTNAKATWDQKRVASPTDALEAGADYLVVGRDIYQAENPREQVEVLTGAIRAWEKN